jgi:hypothetical protein
MLTRALSPDPGLNGSGLGFYETRINGQRAIGHDGDTLYFHSVVSLLPEHNLGLFASINTAGDASHTPSALERAFVSHYFPATLPVVRPPSDANVRNKRYAGRYRTLRHSYTKFEKVLSAAEIRVRPMPDGTLAMPEPDSGQSGRWVEVGDGVFRGVDDDDFIAFKGERDGHTTQLVGTFSPIAAARIAWYESGSMHIVVIAIALLLIATSLVSAIRQRRVDRAGPAAVRWARPVLALTGVLLVAFLIVMALALSGGLEQLMFRIPTSFYVAETFSLLAIPTALAALYFTVRLWSSGTWRLSARLHYTLATLATLAFLLILDYWNLIGYRAG